jgi:hypothetical protein
MYVSCMQFAGVGLVSLQLNPYLQTSSEASWIGFQAIEMLFRGHY